MDELTSTQINSLLNQIAVGNDKAIETLYRHYHRPLFAFVRHLINVDEAADDIVHDTFLAVHKNPLGFNGSCKFFTWLCSIAKNKTLDHQRKTMRRLQLPVEEWNDELADTTADTSWDVLGHFENIELGDIMQGCIDKLPSPQREATYWVYYQDLRLEEVAKYQDSPVNTIKTRLLHARLKLRDCLEKVYGLADRERK
jgi:RNA polymerase sigma-70 factor (ECF subfamily)